MLLLLRKIKEETGHPHMVVNMARRSRRTNEGKDTLAAPLAAGAAAAGDGAAADEGSERTDGGGIWLVRLCWSLAGGSGAAAAPGPCPSLLMLLLRAAAVLPIDATSSASSRWWVCWTL